MIIVTKMAPKRKATDTPAGRASKRSASGPNTPDFDYTISSSDEYTEGGEEASSSEAEDIQSMSDL